MVKKRKRKIHIPLSKESREDLKEARRKLRKELKPLKGTPPSRSARSGSNRFGGLQSAGMPAMRRQILWAGDVAKNAFSKG